jgi:hypothetical protein
VESIRPIKLEDIGGKEWSQQHQNLEKLNMQVVCNNIGIQFTYVDSFNSLTLIIPGAGGVSIDYFSSIPKDLNSLFAVLYFTTI